MSVCECRGSTLSDPGSTIVQHAELLADLGDADGFAARLLEDGAVPLWHVVIEHMLVSKTVITSYFVIDDVVAMLREQMQERIFDVVFEEGTLFEPNFFPFFFYGCSPEYALQDAVCVSGCRGPGKPYTEHFLISEESTGTVPKMIRVPQFRRLVAGRLIRIQGKQISMRRTVRLVPGPPLLTVVHGSVRRAFRGTHTPK